MGISKIQSSNNEKKVHINFYSDFSQLKYVFAEIEQVKKSINENENNDESILSSTEKIKLDILNEELKILSETNEKFLIENQSLKSEINNSNNKILDLQKEIDLKDKKIAQNNVDKEELSFLRLNLIYSSRCQKTAFKKGFKVGTDEYKNCILNKGKKTND